MKSSYSKSTASAWGQDRVRGIQSGFALLVLVVAFSCQSPQPNETLTYPNRLFTIGEWTSFLGYEVTFYKDARITYREGGRTRTARLELRELEGLQTFLQSDDFAAALTDLRARGYEPGCCDMPEVALVVNGESLGYPVCQERPLEESVARFIELVNKLGSRHLRKLRRDPLPTTTCG